MFLSPTLKRNPALIDFAFSAHRRGELLPNTYILDMDALSENGASMLACARENDLTLYFMLKQLGCNPAVAHRLVELGFPAAVSVDWREALSYVRWGVPLGNVGHLVQTPTAALSPILDAKPQIMTLYSVDKARQISDLAVDKGMVQDVMLRVSGPIDLIYSGQTAGIPLEDLPQTAKALKDLPGVRLAGVCAFPCFLYDEESGQIQPTPNTQSVLEGERILTQLGFALTQKNMPSATCVHSIPKIAQAGGTHAEPGHGLTGTTPWHLNHTGETPALVYLSEVSHNFGGQGYCYGGGHYRRSHMSRALVGKSLADAVEMEVTPPDLDSIDYHFTLSRSAQVGDGVVMAFRTQIFVTRGDLAIVEGLSTGSPKVTGVYDAFGNRKV